MSTATTTRTGLQGPVDARKSIKAGWSYGGFRVRRIVEDGERVLEVLDQDDDQLGTFDDLDDALETMVAEADAYHVERIQEALGDELAGLDDEWEAVKAAAESRISELAPDQAEVLDQVEAVRAKLVEIRSTLQALAR